MESSKDPESLIEEVNEKKKKDKQNAEIVLKWFIERSGEMFEWEDCIDSISEDLDINREETSRAIIELTDDSVDPVQMVPLPDKRYVGCLDYIEGEGWYGFEEYHAKYGRRKNVVCAKCVSEGMEVSDVFNPVDGEGRFHVDAPDIEDMTPEEKKKLSTTSGEPSGASYEELSEIIKDHYEERHPETEMEDIEVGASLASGTTINSQTAWHDGNVSGGSNISIGATSVSVSPQGASSGLNADTVDGTEAADLGGGVTNQGFFIQSVTNRVVTTAGQNSSFKKRYSALASGEALFRVYVDQNGDNYKINGKLLKNGSTFTSYNIGDTLTTSAVTSYSQGDTITAVFTPTTATGTGFTLYLSKAV